MNIEQQCYLAVIEKEGEFLPRTEKLTSLPPQGDIVSVQGEPDLPFTRAMTGEEKRQFDAFMEDELTVVIKTDRMGHSSAEFWVEGLYIALPFNTPVQMERSLVSRLGGTRMPDPNGFNIDITSGASIKKSFYDNDVLRFPFFVKEDPAGRIGQEWMQMVIHGQTRGRETPQLGDTKRIDGAAA